MTDTRSPHERRDAGDNLPREETRVLYPSTRYHPDGRVETVADPKADAALGPGWSNSPPPAPDAPATVDPSPKSLVDQIAVQPEPATRHKK